jgi:hypothetical protein
MATAAEQEQEQGQGPAAMMPAVLHKKRLCIRESSRVRVLFCGSACLKTHFVEAFDNLLRH